VATHVKVIAVLFLIFGALSLIGVFFASLVFSVLAGLAGASGEEGAPIGAAVLGLTGVAMSAVFLAFAIPAFAAGYGLLKVRSWGRILAIILAAIALTKIPFGTIFGIYALVIMFNKETERLFAAQASRQPEGPASAGPTSPG
jgi:hypothetical protein